MNLLDRITKWAKRRYIIRKSTTLGVSNWHVSYKRLHLSIDMGSFSTKEKAESIIFKINKPLRG